MLPVTIIIYIYIYALTLIGFYFLFVCWWGRLSKEVQHWQVYRNKNITVAYLRGIT